MPAGAVVITTRVFGAPLSSEGTENLSKNAFFIKTLNTRHGHIIKVPVNQDISLTRSWVNVIHRYSPLINLTKLPVNVTWPPQFFKTHFCLFLAVLALLYSLSLLCRLFSRCGKRELLSTCSAAPPFCGFPAERGSRSRRLQQLWPTGSAVPAPGSRAQWVNRCGPRA